MIPKERPPSDLQSLWETLRKDEEDKEEAARAGGAYVSAPASSSGLDRSVPTTQPPTLPLLTKASSSAGGVDVSSPASASTAELNTPCIQKETLRGGVLANSDSVDASRSSTPQTKSTVVETTTSKHPGIKDDERLIEAIKALPPHPTPSKAHGLVMKTLSESGPPPKRTSDGGAYVSAPTDTPRIEDDDMDVDEPVDGGLVAKPMSREELRQNFPLPTVDGAPKGAVITSTGEVWYAPEGYDDNISIPEDQLRVVHETVANELNLTSCPLTVNTVSPNVMYSYTRRVAELHRRNAEAQLEGQPMAPSVSQVLRVAISTADGLTTPSVPPEFLSTGYDRNTQDQDLNISAGGVAASAPANTTERGESGGIRDSHEFTAWRCSP